MNSLDKKINGRRIRDELLTTLQKEVQMLTIKPIFCDILVGADPASRQYVEMKSKTAEKLGIEVYGAEYPETITTVELVEEIRRLNLMPRMCGLILQLPLPEGIDREAVLNAIAPEIDVDCTGRVNTELFYAHRPRFIFPTAAAIMHIIDTEKISLEGKTVVILGKGELVGRPVETLLRERGISPTVLDRSTTDSMRATKEADIIISATGRAGLVSADMVKENAIIIDAGTSESYGAIVGDVRTEEVLPLVNRLAPVPGGVGPVTVAMLMKNIIIAARGK